MGISSSFNIGVSGMHAMGKGLGVISDNIANAETNGHKASRSEFEDLLSISLKGAGRGNGSDQMGTGVKLGNIKLLMNQGGISRTENATDMAINGNGFFSLETPTGMAYTRDGSMHFDKDGNLVNSDGYKIQGFQSDSRGKISSRLAPIKIQKQTINAKATEEIKVDMNLDSRSKVLEFDMDNPDDTSNYAHSITVYDSVGTSRMVTVYYNKDSDNNWTYRALVDARNAEIKKDPLSEEKPSDIVLMAKGKLIFNDQGVLQEELEDLSSFNFNKGAAPDQKIKFNFGRSLAEGGNGIEASTQFGSDTGVIRHSSDGHNASSLASFSFDGDGILTAIYANGETEKVAQVAIAKFENNEGLHRLGKNLYGETRISGEVNMGKPGSVGRGEIITKSLELSNVDLADQFVDLIATQRSFQANTKTLQTADQMLGEILTIKG